MQDRLEAKDASLSRSGAHRSGLTASYLGYQRYSLNDMELPREDVVPAAGIRLDGSANLPLDWAGRTNARKYITFIFVYPTSGIDFLR
jgi:hypothetical protein